DSDNLVCPCGRGVPVAEMRTDRVLSMEISLDESLIDNCDIAAVAIIALGKTSSLHDLCTDRVEVVGTDAIPGSEIQLGAGQGRRLSFDIHIFAAVLSVHGIPLRIRRMLDAGNCRQRVVQLTVKRIQLFWAITRSV